MTIRNIKSIVMDAGDTETDRFGLNSKFGDNDARLIHGNLTSGDTIRVELSGEANPNETGSSGGYSSPEYDTVVFGDAFIGGWRWFRVIKSGSNGPATIRIEL